VHDLSAAACRVDGAGTGTAGAARANRRCGAYWALMGFKRIGGPDWHEATPRTGSNSSRTATDRNLTDNTLNPSTPVHRQPP